jgi:uncharacterized membrane protein
VAPRWLLNGLIALVAAVWTVNFLAAVFGDWTVNDGVNLVFGSVIGALFGVQRAISRNGNGKPP